MVWTNWEASLDTVVVAPRALVDRSITGATHVRVRDGRIVEVGSGMPRANGVAAQVLDGGLLTPGLIDLQVNGAFGMDFADAATEDIRQITRSFPAFGVTRFLPTLITNPVPDMLAQARAVLGATASAAHEIGARSLGVHLEGPFLSPIRHGVHDPAKMMDPRPELVDEILADKTVLAGLRMVTLAPERPGGMDALRQFVAAGVLVSIGHTDATAAQAKAAADAGARMITHLFNAQRGLAHREPGVPGAGFVDPRFTLGLIGDLAHVTADVVRIVFELAADRVALVTDAVAAAGMPPGHYLLGGSEVVQTEGGVPHAPDGTFAGGGLTLDRAVRNIISLGFDPAVAFTSATTIPADRIGEPALGRLAEGAIADLVWWDDDLRPRKVWIEGELAYAAPPLRALSADGVVSNAAVGQ
jgi:N-acetylglucosamine-6-phosphate deacetylase